MRLGLVRAGVCAREPCVLGVTWRRGKEVDRRSRCSAAEGPGWALGAGRRGCSLQGQAGCTSPSRDGRWPVTGAPFQA